MTATGTHPAGATKNGTILGADGAPPKVEEKALTPMQDFQSVLVKMEPEIKRALPAHLSIERMIRLVLTTARQNPDLLLCVKETVLARIMQCAQLGLEPDGLLGQAWLVPFNNRRNGTKECQLMIGYKGLIKLARNSGEVTAIDARIVNEKDKFDYEYGLEERLYHVPYRLRSATDTPGEPIYTYAIFRFKDGSHHFEVMSAPEIERIRLNCPDPESDAWIKHWGWMWKKSVLRQAAKLSPLSTEDRMARAIALDERAEAGLSQDLDIIDIVEPAKILTASGDVASNLKQRKDIIRAIAKAPKQANLSESDVAGWFKKHSIDELTSDEADRALKQISEIGGQD